MNQRHEKKAATRQRLLDAARDEFAQRGFDDATTREIAKRCGVSIGTLFAHFSHKQSLLQAVLYDGIESAIVEASNKLRQGTGSAQAMNMYASSLYDFYAQNRELSRQLLKHSLFQNDGFSEQLRAFRDDLIARAPGTLTKQKRERYADALLSHYFFVLWELLNDEGVKVQSAVKKLRHLNELVLASDA